MRSNNIKAITDTQTYDSMDRKKKFFSHLSIAKTFNIKDTKSSKTIGVTNI
jgi:hypothetical protein